MSRYLPYEPDQVYLLPPDLAEVLGSDHLALFLHRLLKKVSMQGFYAAYSEEGGATYAPEMMLRVWLYAYTQGITSSRKLERRIREDLGFRYLAGGAQPDYWALNQFRRRHRKALNDVFTQVVEAARERGLGRLGKVAIDATRVKASASRYRVDSEEQLRREREAAMPQRLEKLQKSGLKKLSRTDGEARFQKVRSGFDLAYTADIAVSEDQQIVAQRLTQQSSDNASLVPMVAEVKRQCGGTPRVVLADAGFYSYDNLEAMRQNKIDAYIPDPRLARELNTGKRCRNQGVGPIRHPEGRKMQHKLRSPAGRMMYGKRKALVEPVFGVLKEQRGMRQFRMRGLHNVAIEFTLACIAYNLTRMHQVDRTA